MGITYHGASGQTLYVRFSDETAVDMTEGSGLSAGQYTVADSAIVTAGLTAGTYTGRILVGTAAAQAAGDVQVGVVEAFIFDGTAETPQTTVPISADRVADERTHFADVDGYQAGNIIEVKQNFAGTLSLAPLLNSKTDILTVDSVSITGAATVTATGLATTADRKRANYTVPALATVGTYTVLVTITTTDGQTIPTTATLKVI